MDKLFSDPKTMENLQNLMSDPKLKDMMDNNPNMPDLQQNTTENAMPDFSKLTDLMSNPAIQKLATDPNIQKMMSSFGMPSMPSVPLDPSMSQPNSEQKAELENKYKKNDIILINNLKNVLYNNRTAKILFYNPNTNRYIVELDNDKQISVKEDNCFDIDNSIENVD